MPPVNVHLPAGPATPDSPVFLDSAEPLVLATAFLPWQSYPAAGAVPARVSLPSWLMIRLWIKRSVLSSLPVDLAVLAVVEFGLIAVALLALFRTSCALQRRAALTLPEYFPGTSAAD